MPYPSQLLRNKGDLGSPDTAHHTLQTLPTIGAGSTAVMPDGPHDHVLFTFRQENSDDERLADSSTTADIVVVHWHGSGADAVISGQVTVSAHPLYRPIAAFIPVGHTFWVYVGAVTNPTATADHLAIHWTPIRKPS